MFQDNPLLVKLKKKLHSKMPRIEGIIKSSERGFGFLEIDFQKSYFIPPKNMKKVMHGDRIRAILKTEQNREIIEPEKLIDPFLKTFVGKIHKTSNQLFILPDFPLINNLIKCTNKSDLSHNFKHGDWAIAKLTKHKLEGHQFFFAELIDFIVTEKNHLYPWLVTLSANNLKKESPILLNHEEIIFDDSISRHDLTNLDFITIDSLETKDIDDAIFIEQNHYFFTVYVAIADPSSYISQNSRLDNIAKERGFTNYLPGFTIPMLPNELSEDICSLLPNVRRPVVVCRFNVLLDGRILDDSIVFFMGWIQSKSKLVYDNVSNWLDKKIGWEPELKSIRNQIILLHKLYQIRFFWRKNNALIFRDRPEYKFYFSKDNLISNIIIEPRRIAHRMIEEAMIAANVCAAKFLSKHLGYGIYNIHKGFADIINAEHAVALLSKFKINFTVKDIMTLDGFCKMHRELNILSNSYLDARIRKFQSFGEINIYPDCHYSLGFEKYATWTSPIRKYSDIINHRLLKSIILKQPSIKIHHDVLININDKKRKYRIVKRSVEDWLYILYFNQKNKKINQYDAEIIDIYKSGIRARLLENGANVFIPATFLHFLKEELFLDKENGLVYIKNDIAYKLTDIIQVNLIDIKKSTRNIIAKPKSCSTLELNN
ncbi:Exoribonuclease 2 [Buchnera aphidicola (Eriosoma grossulariae)]|uniref:exoribonuclease II n=1 Tax=Buchnera aphidicola TaxID=9 RepID=UPI0034642A12